MPPQKRTRLGLNTNATHNLNNTEANRHFPPTQPLNQSSTPFEIANQLDVKDWGAVQSIKNSPAQINRNYYSPSPNLDALIQSYRLPEQPLHDKFTYAQPVRQRYILKNGQWINDNGAVFQDYNNALANAPRPMQYSPGSLSYDLLYDSGVGATEFKTKWGTINGKSGFYPEGLLGSSQYPDSLYGWNKKFIKLPNGKLIAPNLPPRASVDVMFDQYTHGKLLNERESLADLEGKQRYGMTQGNKDLTFDSTLGMTEFGNGGWIVRPQNQNKQLGEAFNSQPIQMIGFDVERGVGGASDYRQMPAANRRVLSDSYSMAPQWTSDVGRYNNAAAFLNEQGASGAGILPGILPYEQSRNIQRLPVPTPEEALTQAQLKNIAARSAYHQERQSLINQRPGSFNLYTEPEHIKSFASENIADDAITGVYSKGKPFQVQVSPDGYVGNLPDNLEIYVPGLGYFPLTRGRTLEKISLSSTEPPLQLNENGTFEMRSVNSKGKPVKNYSMPDDVYERNGNIPFMMDALQALQAKEQMTNTAWAKFSGSVNSPTVSDVESYNLQKIASIHQQELEAAKTAYHTALNILEPQASTQKAIANIYVKELGEYPELLKSHGLDIVSTTPTESGFQIQASGSIPVEKQIALSGELASRLNRRELVLPKDVSIANGNSKAFKEAGIPDGALVQGVEWKTNEDGNPRIANPGVVVGHWNGERITRGNFASSTVLEIPTAATPVLESDSEWQQLINARDKARAAQRDKLIDGVNIKRLERGEPLLAVGKNGQLFHLSQDNVSVATPDQISNTARAAAARKRKDGFAEVNNAALEKDLEQLYRNSLVEQNIKLATGDAPVYSSPPTYYSNQTTMPSKKVKVQARISDAFEDDLALLHQTEHPMDRIHKRNPLVRRAVTTSPQLGSNRFDLSAIANEISPLVRPATVNLNAPQYATGSWIQQAPDVPINEPMPDAIALARQRIARTGIPIEGDDTVWSYSRPQPQVSREIYSEFWPEFGATPQPSQQPVMVQDPANSWNKYIPAAAALGGLGLGAGIGYAMAPRNSGEEEQLRQQLMHGQAYLQQMQQIRSGRR